MKQPIYVVGHCNPDTDSICSAISYAALMNRISEEEYVPRRAGQINEETQFVLKKFHIKEPALLTNVHLQAGDMDIHRVEGVSSSTSIKTAWQMMMEEPLNTVPIVRDGYLEGLITIGDIAKSYMDNYDNGILARARTKYLNIVNVLDGTILTGNTHSYFSKGKVAVAASNRTGMEKLIKENDLVILGDRREAQKICIDLNVSCMIVCQDGQIEEAVIKEAEKKSIVIISTGYDTFTAARLINQSIPVKYFMTDKDKLISFKMRDYVENMKDVMSKKRHRDFPVLNQKGQFVGLLSRRRLLASRKKRVVLVDHNEKSQAVDGIEEAEILEIIDHHRLGSLETIGPVSFRNQPVGCTATIISQMYREHGLAPTREIAQLLCAAIISDTLLYRSPTCTDIDRGEGSYLAGIAGVDMEELAKEMFHAGSNLEGKTPEEIVYQDFKTFDVNEIRFGIGQVSFMSEEEIVNVKEKVRDHLKHVLKKEELQMVFLMLTNILDESSEVLCAGDGAKEELIEAFDLPEETLNIQLPGVVSRKKQMVPELVMAMQN